LNLGGSALNVNVKLTCYIWEGRKSNVNVQGTGCEGVGFNLGGSASSGFVLLPHEMWRCLAFNGRVRVRVRKASEMLCI
jgi:hypothetical protein